MALSRDGILGADDMMIEPVPCPEWGDTVLIRGLTGEERDDWEESVQQIRQLPDGSREMHFDRRNARARFLVLCIVDETGQRIFKDSDAPALGKKNGKVLDRLYDVGAALSGITEEAQEEIEGNSDAAPSGDSSSISPESSDSLPLESSLPASLPES
ncbi:phage tail assembly chaperone [Streptomyces sp. NPDC051320]|uniref:phage tail assembly chaperone n=1 Tax=Streptomyces sp. NPDC051320 TaxID=3154644 RepID=UPI00343D50E9